jgi:hypothetical protein
LLRFKCLKRYFITDVFSVSNMRVTIVKWWDYQCWKLLPCKIIFIR